MQILDLSGYVGGTRLRFCISLSPERGTSVPQYREGREVCEQSVAGREGLRLLRLLPALFSPRAFSTRSSRCCGVSAGVLCAASLLQGHAEMGDKTCCHQVSRQRLASRGLLTEGNECSLGLLRPAGSAAACVWMETSRIAGELGEKSNLWGIRRRIYDM